MIDVKKYEGRVPDPWEITSAGYIKSGDRHVADVLLTGAGNSTEREATRALLVDAPDLLAEVVRLRAELAEVVAALQASRTSLLPAHMVAARIDAVLAKHGGRHGHA
jgi:hypothetical protein